VSWQLASFALVLASLAGAFWWYERSHPPAKLVAVIATLAALAALGRDAFAAVPDVKPITAMVLIAGVAFGAGPGFAVGAISGLASNVLLGEGPWTPWQMLGWGLVGVLGAALGALTGRRPPPLVLALSCALAAEAFNLIVDLYTWTGVGSHTLAAFGAVLASAVVFDATHVIASFGFALAFGNVLLRMLLRVRARLEIVWEASPLPATAPLARARRRALPLAAALAALIAVPAIAVAAGIGRGAGHGTRRVADRAAVAQGTERAKPLAGAAAVRRALTRELDYIAAAQNSDGGFGGARGKTSSELYEAWVAMGLAAAGRAPSALRRDGHSVLDALRSEAGELNGAGDIERTILALRACGASPRTFPGGDLIARLLQTRHSDGSFGGLTNLTAFAILSLRASGYGARDPLIRRAAGWTAAQQDRDGGFGFTRGGGASDVDDTAAVLQALASAGTRRGPRVTRALAYMTALQNPDGGFPQERGGPSDSQSTAWAVQAYAALDRDPETVRRRGSRSPIAYILSLIAPDGSVRYSRTGAQTPVWVTAQALTALARRPLPIVFSGH
jgi:energy-coupling factor transport system substrate-specific component